MRSQVEPNGDCVVRARKRGAQKALGALHLAADAHERAQIGERRLRVGVSAQCEAHCQFGFLDGAHSVAGDAKIDIGVGPTRLELGRLAESPRRLLRVPDGEARLAVGVMRRGPLRSAMTSFACRKQSRLGVADGEQGNRAVQVRRVVIREGPLGSSEGANGLVMSTCPLKRDPELQSHWTVRGVDGQRRFQSADRVLEPVLPKRSRTLRAKLLQRHRVPIAHCHIAHRPWHCPASNARTCGEPSASWPNMVARWLPPLETRSRYVDLSSSTRDD